MRNPIYLLTPCFNAASTIDRTIWTIVSQQGEGSVRYHVQDGGSTDGTCEILAQWEQRLQKMRDHLPMHIDFSFASERDSGMYDGIDKGFRRMNIPENSIMGWCNADDTLWQGAIDCLQKIDHLFPDLEWFTGWPTSFDESGRLKSFDHEPFFPRPILSAGLADGRTWPHLQQESTFWRKRLWDRAEGIDQRFKMAGDWDLWRRFAQSQELVHVDRQLGSFHYRRGQKSSDIVGYYAECDGLIPKAKRQTEFNHLVESSPNWGVSRIAITKTGKFQLHRDLIELNPFKKLKAKFRSNKYLLRKLKQHHSTVRRQNLD